MQQRKLRCIILCIGPFAAEIQRIKATKGLIFVIMNVRMNTKSATAYFFIVGVVMNGMQVEYLPAVFQNET